MFKKILIANRGEIACRIMRTCQRMGLSTVGVYSEVDSQSLHVDWADEAHLIGASPAQESYLNFQNIIDVALKSGAEAIHPGYGFLSENSAFAEAVEAAGLVFIGPRPEVIQMMGDKLQAKAIARQANVPVLEGTLTPISTLEEVKDVALSHGYPLLLKAAAGGGGKGMRVVHQEDQIQEALQRTTHEALASFGDGRIFVEKYMDTPRHIEIQILADKYGTILHLGERDCSLQRRHQKVIEESPSPFMTPELREAMTSQAVALAKAVGYTSAGTVEFMVAPDRTFYFLEMNTRLQVEHPITEMVTGIDLVEQMIRIAAGEPLSFSQTQISFTGHAVEARLYAEDASQEFMPSSGRITRFEVPLEEGLRLDTGVEAGSNVSIYYDPLLAKVISFAPTRLEAFQKLQRTLATMVVEGPITNLGFLEQLLLQPEVIAGSFTTHFIEKEMVQDLAVGPKRMIPAIAALIYHRVHEESPSGEWIIVEKGQGTQVVLHDDEISVEGEVQDIDLHWFPRERHFVAKWKEQTYYGQVQLTPMGMDLTLFGTDHHLQVMTPKVWDLYTHVRPPESPPDNLTVKAPMPGILTSLAVEVGDHVKPGQILFVIEAMKMENALKSTAEAIVKEIFVKPGDSLTRNQILATLQ